MDDKDRLVIMSIVESAMLDLEGNRAHPCPLHMFTEKQLAKIIKGLKPHGEVAAGQKFLLQVLKEKGVDGLDRFMQKAMNAIHENGQLKPSEDFDDYERRVLRFTTPNMSRRKVLIGFATLGGLGAIGAGVTKEASHLLKSEDAPSSDHTKNPVSKEKPLPSRDGESLHVYMENAHELIVKAGERIEAIQPGIDVTLGSVAVAYAVKEYFDARFDQVVTAINDVAKKTRSGEWTRG